MKPKRKPASARVWVAVDPKGGVSLYSVRRRRRDAQRTAISPLSWTWRDFYRAGWRVKRATLTVEP